MRILNFNIKLGGQTRTPEIINYLISNDFYLIVLTEFIMNDKGKEIRRILTDNGYKTQASNEDGYGSFIACKNEFVTVKVEDRWTEVHIPEIDLYVLAVYVPDQPGKPKNVFWNKILEYAEINIENNVMITGDFNSCTKDDSSNGTEYYAKDLMKLEELKYIDLWKCYSKEDSDRYTWFYHSGDGFRLDYTFISPKLDVKLEEIVIYHDSVVRKSKVSDHSPLVLVGDKITL